METPFLEFTLEEKIRSDIHSTSVDCPATFSCLLDPPILLSLNPKSSESRKVIKAFLESHFGRYTHTRLVILMRSERDMITLKQTFTGPKGLALTLSSRMALNQENLVTSSRLMMLTKLPYEDGYSTLKLYHRLL